MFLQVQPYLTPTYMMDRGVTYQQFLTDDADFTGWSNQKLVPELSDPVILEHIQKIQRANQIAPSPKLEGRFNLTIEMETGVGKTYTYIKTMYELNKHYGWSKSLWLSPAWLSARVYINLPDDTRAFCRGIRQGKYDFSFITPPC